MSADVGAGSSANRDRSERWSQLLALLAQKGRLSVTEAVAALGVSEATVRRDFSDLAAQQLVTRTHGGVVASAVAYDLPARYRSAASDTAKERIAARAAACITPDTVVGFNGGTTTSAAARHLAMRPDLVEAGRSPSITIVTNALNIATELVLRPYIRCVSLGGVARSESYEMSGPLAAKVLSELWLDVAIIGVDSVSAAGGACCNHEGEAGINALMVERAQHVIAVATGDKVGRRSLARICESSAINTLITDPTAPSEAVEALREAGVTVEVIT